MNISITDDQAVLVDRLTRKYDFANRSELFRTLLRLVSRQPQVLHGVGLELIEFKKRPLREIEQGMVATGKYSKKFVKSIIDGLQDSSVYANS
jgi:Arc/MetJ-type ribon-helix-helix transcriptional regulator